MIENNAPAIAATGLALLLGLLVLIGAICFPSRPSCWTCRGEGIVRKVGDGEWTCDNCHGWWRS